MGQNNSKLCRSWSYQLCHFVKNILPCHYLRYAIRGNTAEALHVTTVILQSYHIHPYPRPPQPKVSIPQRPILQIIYAHGPLARYVKLGVAHAPGMPGTILPPPRVSDPDTHVPWCIPGSLIEVSFEFGGEENVPAFTTHAQHANLRIW